MSLKQKNLEQYLQNTSPHLSNVLSSWKILREEHPVFLQEYLIDNGIFTRRQMDEVLAQIPWDSPNDIPVIPGYTLIDRIGQGGMGRIYKAFHHETHALYAIKVLLKELAGDEEYKKRFLREGKIASGLSHPHIVKCSDVFSLGNTLAISFEWIEGGNLKDFIDRNGVLSPLKTLELGICMAQAMECYEACRLIHRDIKPANILLPFYHPPKLADFGLARKNTVSGSAPQSVLTLEGNFLGTVNYCSPEQLEGIREIDIRSDIYALGITLFYCMTGETPFSFKTMAHAMTTLIYNQKVPEVQKIQFIPKPFAICLEKMMAAIPQNRYQHPKELLAMLNALHESLSKTKSLTSPIVSGNVQSPDFSKGNTVFPAVPSVAFSTEKTEKISYPGKAGEAPEERSARQGKTLSSGTRVDPNGKDFLGEPEGDRVPPTGSHNLRFDCYEEQSDSWIAVCEIPLPAKREVTIGRNHTNDICIRVPDNQKRSLHISGSHCKLSVVQDCWNVIDMGSTNGTFVNGERLKPNCPSPLRHRIPVELGKKEVRLLIYPRSSSSVFPGPSPAVPGANAGTKISISTTLDGIKTLAQGGDTVVQE